MQKALTWNQTMRFYKERESQRDTIIEKTIVQFKQFEDFLEC